MECFKRCLPLIPIDQIIPIRDHVVDGAAIMAIRNAAIHAARRLLRQLCPRQGGDIFLVILQALLRLDIAAIGAFKINKASCLTHNAIPPCGLFGRNRDTAWFACIDAEWPALRECFEAWLSPRNFDARGQQQERLSDMTGLVRAASDPAL
jgi:hypothetical protein